MLNNKQKAYLKGLANRLKVSVMVGKEGISDTLITSLDNSLNAHELVKIAVLKTVPNTVNEIKVELAAATHSEIVQTIGRNIVLFRKKTDSNLVLPK